MNTATSVVRVDDESYETVLAEEPLVLLHFRADWCEPCNGAVEPVLADLAEAYDEDLVVAEVDAETGRRAIDAFDVETLLTSVLVAQGEEVARFRGKTPYVNLARAVETHRQSASVYTGHAQSS